MSIEQHEASSDVPWQAEHEAALLGALGGVALSELPDNERRILSWLAGWEASTVSAVVALIARARDTAGEASG